MIQRPCAWRSWRRGRSILHRDGLRRAESPGWDRVPLRGSARGTSAARWRWGMTATSPALGEWRHPAPARGSATCFTGHRDGHRRRGHHRRSALWARTAWQRSSGICWWTRALRSAAAGNRGTSNRWLRAPPSGADMPSCARQPDRRQKLRRHSAPAVGQAAAEGDPLAQQVIRGRRHDHGQHLASWCTR